MLSRTCQGVQTLFYSCSNDTERLVSLSERDDALQRVEAADAEIDEAPRPF